MTESNDNQAPVTVPPPAPIVSAETNEVAFHEQVRTPRGRSSAARAGVIAGSALLVLVGVVAAMGASPSPSTDPTSGTGADPSADPSTAPAPAASAAPNTTTPNAPKMDHRGGPGGFGKHGGIGVGFRDITITAIDGSSISLKTDDGWTRTIEATSTTTITKGGATITIGDLAVGDQIRFAQQRGTDGTYTVTAIVVVLPTVAGEVTAIDGNTITITQPGGTTTTVHVDGDTTYRVNGGAGSLADIKVGSIIVAEGTQRADGSLDAAAIGGGLKGGLKDGFRGHGGFPDGLGGDRAPKASPAPSSGAS